MRTSLFSLGLLLLPAFASAGSNISGDAWIPGRLMIGTTTANGRFTVVVSTPDRPAFLTYFTIFEGGPGYPIVNVGIDGHIGISTKTAARLDITARGDSGDVAAMLRNGAAYPASANPQITFARGGSTDYRHSIASVHIDSTAHNSIDFKIWSPDAGASTALATMTVLSLTTISTASGASFHVRPFGDPEVELVVSNGGLTGGGSIHVANEVTPSSRKIKKDIAYLGEVERAAAADDIRAMKHVSFRYMKSKRGRLATDRSAPLHRGLLYEEAPQTLRGPGDSLIFDQRLLESEMGLQELAKKLEALGAEVGQ